MRLYSTPESVKRGEVSVLAIAETVAAVGLVFYLSAHLNTLKWLAVAMCVAPLLLLRTEESTRLGIQWFDAPAAYGHKAIMWVNDSMRLMVPQNPIRFVVIAPIWLTVILLSSLVYFTLGAFVVRFLATVTNLFQAPLSSLRAIPRNWARVALATDLCCSPEVVPDHPRWNWKGFNEAFETDQPPVSFIFGGFPVADFITVLLCLPAAAYRWSLKATSIIYLPLVFVLHSTFRHVADLRTKLELIKRSDITRITTVYALVFITAFLLKLVCMMNLPGFADWWKAHPMSQFAALYVAPAEIPKWQLASLTNCVLALVVMGGARHALLRIELGMPWPESIVRHALGFTTGVRWLLSLYTILCTGYVTMNAARGWHWPALGSKWLPWL